MQPAAELLGWEAASCAPALPQSSARSCLAAICCCAMQHIKLPSKVLDHGSSCPATQRRVAISEVQPTCACPEGPAGACILTAFAAAVSRASCCCFLRMRSCTRL